MTFTYRPFFKIMMGLSLIYGLGKVINTQMHGFGYLNFTIQPPKGYSLDFNNPQDMEPILSQKFTFFNYGGESLVFTSEDNQWVLKVFKKNRLYPLRELQWLNNLPLLSSHLHKRTRVYARFWKSLKIQAESVAELSKLHYVHLPYDNKPLPPITLVDPIGSVHHMNFDKVCFVIQEKGELFRQVYARAITQEQKTQMLTKLVNFYRKLESKKLKIWDNAVSKNMGWKDGYPFLIDTGSVSPKPPSETLHDTTKHLKIWVQRHAPEQEQLLLSLIAGQ